MLFTVENYTCLQDSCMKMFLENLKLFHVSKNYCHMDLMQRKTDRYLDTQERYFELTLLRLNLVYIATLAYRPG